MIQVGTLERTNNWTDFAYGGIVASGMGITRVSDGSRFNEDLLPTQTHKTATVPGRKGTYYFGSDSTQLNITVQFAFEGLTDNGYKELSQWVRASGLHALAFDNGEYYKDVKITRASIKYLPFEPTQGQNAEIIYKGEGTLQFTCYDSVKYIWFNPNEDESGLWTADGKILVDSNNWIILPADQVG